MPYFEYVYDGVEVQARSLQNESTVALAVGVMRIMDAQRTNSAFVADLIKEASLFSPVTKPYARHARLSRMLFDPIRVGGRVMALESEEARSRYQKTKRITLVLGELEPMVEDPHANVNSFHLQRPWTAHPGEQGHTRLDSNGWPAVQSAQALAQVPHTGTPAAGAFEAIRRESQSLQNDTRVETLQREVDGLKRIVQDLAGWLNRGENDLLWRNPADLRASPLERRLMTTIAKNLAVLMHWQGKVSSRLDRLDPPPSKPSLDDLSDEEFAAYQEANAPTIDY